MLAGRTYLTLNIKISSSRRNKQTKEKKKLSIYQNSERTCSRRKSCSKSCRKKIGQTKCRFTSVSVSEGAKRAEKRKKNRENLSLAMSTVESSSSAVQQPPSSTLPLLGDSVMQASTSSASSSSSSARRRAAAVEVVTMLWVCRSTRRAAASRPQRSSYSTGHRAAPGAAAAVGRCLLAVERRRCKWNAREAGLPHLHSVVLRRLPGSAQDGHVPGEFLHRDRTA